MRWESWLLRVGLAGLAAYQIATGNTPGAIVAAQGCIVALLPRLIERLSKTPIPRAIEFLFVFGMALQYGSESLKLFELFTYWDKIVHPTLVALTAWLAIWLLLGYRDAFHKRLPLHLAAAIGLLLGIAVGALWEWVEFVSDWFGNADLQKSNADTITDIIANNTGAFVAMLLSVSLYPRWLSSDEHRQAGQLARWLSHGPSRLLDRHGGLVGATVATAVTALIVGAMSIDRGWPSLPSDVAPGPSLAWTGLDQPDPAAVVLSGDWVPDPSRGTCRVNLDHPKPGSEKPGLLEIAPTFVYGLNDQAFRMEARVFQERPPVINGTQMDGGLAFGIRDAHDFYLLEQSPLHDILRLDRYVHNRRRDVREKLMRTHGNEWHTLHVRVRGSQIVAGMDGQDVYSVTIADAAGGIGLWARTAAATCFQEARLEVAG